MRMMLSGVPSEGKSKKRGKGYAVSGITRWERRCTGSGTKKLGKGRGAVGGQRRESQAKGEHYLAPDDIQKQQEAKKDKLSHRSSLLGDRKEKARLLAGRGTGAANESVSKKRREVAGRTHQGMGASR